VIQEIRKGHPNKSLHRKVNFETQELKLEIMKKQRMVLNRDRKTLWWKPVSVKNASSAPKTKIVIDFSSKEVTV
jgi:hypothetical protein